MNAYIMKYSNYKKEDFIVDEYFKSWVIHPNAEADFFWESFLINNPDKFNTILAAKELILSMSFRKIQEKELNLEEVDSMLSNVLQRHNTSELKKRNVGSSNSRISPGFIVRIAAVLVIISIIGVSWFYKNMPNEKEQLIEESYLIKETSKGEKLTIRLPDKSIVVLNSSSRLEYPASFSTEHRILKFSGEAYFEVVNDKNRPFIIQSNQFSTQVKGTSFAVKKDEHKNTIDVSVVTGLVEVFYHNEIGDKKEVEVKAQQMVSFNSTINKFEKKPLDFNEMVAWKDGILHFQNADFNEIMKKLENWYGVNITVSKSLDRRRDFSGQFENESLEMVLKGIGFVYGFNYIINGNEVIIR